MQFWNGCQGFFGYTHITLTHTKVCAIFSRELTPHTRAAFGGVERTTSKP